LDLVAGTPDYASRERCVRAGRRSGPAALAVAGTASDGLFSLENVAMGGLSEVKGLTPGQLRGEVEAGG